MYFAHGADFKVNVKDDEQTWCSIACRDSVPPLAAQPAETNLCGALGCVTDIETACLKCGYESCWKHVEGHACQPAPQPAPAKLDVCGGCRCSKADVIECRFNERDRRWCGGCREKALKWSAMQSGTPYTGPERLERPKLAHSYGVEDDCLPEAGR
jgi:hypothetical protein